MDACGCDPGFAAIFDRRTAERDRERYRRGGPDRTTGLLLGMIRRRGVRDRTVLDIGGGIGVIPLELAGNGLAEAVLVDASRAYLAVAREELAERGVGDRVRLVEGDFTGLADGIGPADVVTLDRVICCYPDVDRLVELSAQRARRLYGLVLPRDRWFIAPAIALENAWFALRRSPYRAFAHPNTRVDSLVEAAGLRCVDESRTAFWRVALYERAA